MMHYYLQAKNNPDKIISAFGYSFIHACERNKLNPDEWDIFDCEYID